MEYERQQKTLDLFMGFRSKGADRRAARAATAEAMKIDPDSVRRYLSDAESLGLSATITEERPEPAMPGDDDLREMWDRLEHTSKKEIRKRSKQGKATIRILSPDPVGFAALTDAHLGSPETDYARARYDAQLIKSTPGMHVILGGDIVDNFISPRILEPLLQAEVTPQNQWSLAGHFLEMFGGKILAVVSGNHEHRTKMVSGIDNLASLVQGKNVLYDPDEFYITIKLGEQEYNVLVRHKPSRWNSSMNLTHAGKQIIRFGDYDTPPDIVIIGHHHAPAVEYVPWGGQMRTIIRTGSYLAKGDYERRHGFTGGGYMVPTVVLHPDRKEVLVIPSLETARDYLNYIHKEEDDDRR